MPPADSPVACGLRLLEAKESETGAKYGGFRPPVRPVEMPSNDSSRVSASDQTATTPPVWSEER